MSPGRGDPGVKYWRVNIHIMHAGAVVVYHNKLYFHFAENAMPARFSTHAERFRLTRYIIVVLLLHD